LDDLEEDPALRHNVNIYAGLIQTLSYVEYTKIDKDRASMLPAVETDEMETSDGDELPSISLQEMLDDMHLEEDVGETEKDEETATIIS
jgi:hypothetical protein